ncbi:MAG: hypothetical protein ACOY7P_02390 [Pseudomonadota bacterium]
MTPPSRRSRFAGAAAALAVALLQGGCGGGSPLGNPPDIGNPPGTEGRKLAFAYYQRCIFPLLLAELPVVGGSGTNTCAGGGCHDDSTGTGGALRVVRGAATLDVTTASADEIRASDMYKNYYSAQGVTIPGDPLQSRLLAKPLLLNMLHGGGQIFESEDDPNAKLIRYWIDHPAPSDQDEFSPATYGMFNPPDPNTGACKTD